MMASNPNPSSKSTLRYLVSGSAAVLLNRVAGAGLRLLIPALLARWVPAEHVGVYFLALSVAGFLEALGALGNERNTLIYVAHARTLGEPGVGRLAARRVLGLVLTASVTLALVFALGFPWVEASVLDAEWFGRGSVWVAAAGLSAAAIGVASAAFAGAKQLARSSLFRGLATPLLFLLFVLVLRRAAIDLDGMRLLQILAAASGCSAVLAWLALELSWRRFPLPAEAPSADRCPSRRRILVESAPLLGAQLLGIAIAQGDLWLVGQFDYGAVPGYGAAARLALVPGLLVGISGSVVGPLVVEYNAGNRLRSLEPLLQRVASATAAATSVYVLALVVVAGPALSWVFGPEFESGANPLRVLLIAHSLPVLAGSPVHVLSLLGGQSQAFRITALASSVFGVLGVLATARYGATGAALALFIAQALLAGGALISIRRAFGIWVWASPLAWLRPVEQDR